MKMAMSRRWMAVPVAALAASLSLTACGSDDAEDTKDSDASPAAAADLLPEAEGTTEYPLELESPFGTSTLEERPLRIATIGYINDLDNTLALDITPVWADEYAAEYPWTQDAGADKIEKLGTAGDDEDFAMEQLLAAEPDLIIAIQTDPDTLGDNYDDLKEIAPVLTTDAPGFDVTWEDTVKAIGEATDLSAAAEDVIADVYGQVDAAAAANPEFAGTSITFAQWVFGGNDPGPSYRTWAGGDVSTTFERLGFTLPATASEFTRDNFRVSAENYGKFDADRLLVAAPKADFEALLTEPTFASIPAVLENRYAFIDLDVEENLGWATSWPSALNVPYTIERVVPALAATFQ